MLLGHPQESACGGWVGYRHSPLAPNAWKGTPGRFLIETHLKQCQNQGQELPFQLAAFLFKNVMITYFYLPSKMSWFSRCCAVSKRSSSLLLRDASASRRKLAHLWKSSSLKIYAKRRGLFTALGDSLPLPMCWASYGPV